MNRRLEKYSSKTARYLHSHASLILSCVSAAGVVCTTVSAVKATPKALKLIKKAEEQKEEKLTKFEVLKTAGSVYIPSVLFGASTVACIFGTNVLNQRRQASLISTYGLLNESYKTYKKKVNQLYGDDADNLISRSVSIDKAKEYNKPPDSKLLTFYDEFSERFFESSMEDVLKAEYELNRLFILRGYVTANDFYNLLGLAYTDYADNVGWSIDAGKNLYGYSWIDFEHDLVTVEEGDDPEYGEYYRIIMINEPAIDYDIIIE